MKKSEHNNSLRKACVFGCRKSIHCDLWEDGHPEHWRKQVESLGFGTQPIKHVYDKTGMCKYCGHTIDVLTYEKLIDFLAYVGTGITEEK